MRAAKVGVCVVIEVCSRRCSALSAQGTIRRTTTVLMARQHEPCYDQATFTMASQRNTIDFLLDQLRGLSGVHTRKMFGEYALYYDDKVVALVCDDQLFVKISPPGKALVGLRYAEGRPYPGARPHLLVSAEDLEDHERLCELVRVTAAALPPPKPKSPRRGIEEGRSTATAATKARGRQAATKSPSPTGRSKG